MGSSLFPSENPCRLIDTLNRVQNCQTRLVLVLSVSSALCCDGSMSFLGGAGGGGEGILHFCYLPKGFANISWPIQALFFFFKFTFILIILWFSLACRKTEQQQEQLEVVHWVRRYNWGWWRRDRDIYI